MFPQRLRKLYTIMPLQSLGALLNKMRKAWRIQIHLQEQTLLPAGRPGPEHRAAGCCSDPWRSLSSGQVDSLCTGAASAAGLSQEHPPHNLLATPAALGSLHTKTLPWKGEGWCENTHELYNLISQFRGDTDTNPQMKHFVDKAESLFLPCFLWLHAKLPEGQTVLLHV